jgi:hypothetical protein
MPTAAARPLSLKAHDRVVLVVEALPALPATVATTGRSEATLVLDQGAVPARVLHRRPASIETTVGGRRYRGDGELHMVSGRGRVRDDAVRFCFQPDAPPLRRVHERMPAILPVTVVPVRADVAPARGLTVDISAGGALVRAPRAMADGHELLLHLELPGEDLPIPARGAVVRRTADGLLGVELSRMRPADRALVMDWVLRNAQRDPRHT